jgi:hypothetical protein
MQLRCLRLECKYATIKAELRKIEGYHSYFNVIYCSTCGTIITVLDTSIFREKLDELITSVETLVEKLDERRNPKTFHL